MLRELDSVVLRHDRSLGGRILLWLYPNRGWKSDSDGAGTEPAAGLGADATPSSSPRREETTYAV